MKSAYIIGALGTLIMVLLVFLISSHNNVPRLQQVVRDLQEMSKDLHSMAPDKGATAVTKEAVIKEEQPLDWDRILHFIPKRSRNKPITYGHSCLNLFTTESSRWINITQEMKEMHKLISNELNSSKGYKGKLTPEHPKLTLTYQELARQDFVHRVCEIGFNVGQSAIAWLTTKPHLELYSFDLATLSGAFTKHMGEILKKKYPGRFNLTLGDSTKTVLKWAQQHGKKCDILSIDGDHHFLAVLQDLLNMKVLAAQKHIIIADDIDMQSVREAWLKLMDVGYIHYLYHCRVPKKDIDFAIGYYSNV